MSGYNISLVEELAELRLGDGRVYVDLETTGLDSFSDKITLVQVLSGKDVSLYRGNDFEPLKDILEDDKVVKVFQNAKFDLLMLKAVYPGLRPVNLFDTFLAESVIDPTASRRKATNLQALAWKYLRVWMPKGLRSSFDGDELTEGQIQYAALDVIVLEGIMKAQVKRLAELGLVETARLEFAIVPALVDIERKGMCLDLKRLREMKPVLDLKARELEEKLNALAGREVNWRSPQQVVSALRAGGYKVESSSAKGTQEARRSVGRRSQGVSKDRQAALLFRGQLAGACQCSDRQNPPQFQPARY